MASASLHSFALRTANQVKALQRLKNFFPQ